MSEVYPFPNGAKTAFTTLLHNKLLPLPEFKALLGPSNLDYTDTISLMNKHFHSLQMSVRVADVTCPYTERKFITYVSPTGKTYKSFGYKPEQVAYFEVLLSHFLNSNDLDPSRLAFWMDLVNLRTNVEKFSIDHKSAETFLKDFIKKYFLYELRTDGDDVKLGLGLRSLAQFQQEIFDRSDVCLICQESLFLGISCEQCSAVLHKSCFKQFLEQLRHLDFKCPQCRGQFLSPDALSATLNSLGVQ
ncbi:hypothetical protein GEMRC1_002691 [Eukaryota sp. GEM-RC1]